MFVEPISEDPVRQFTDAEERRLTKNLSLLTKDVRLVDSKTKIYSVDLVRSWHSRLFDGVRDHAGRFRTHDYGENILNFGPNRSSPREEVMSNLDAHVADTHKLLSQLDDIEKKGDPLLFVKDAIKVALYLHAAFIKIHPFRDGNGRIGRLVMNFVLSKYGIPPLVIETPKKEYINCLNYYYYSKDIEPLYEFAIRVYKNQI